MKKYIKLLLILTLIIVFTGCEKKTNSEDAQKFKVEYESLNGTLREKDGKEVRSIDIPKENAIVYTTAEEIAKEMKNKKTFAVYFGFNDCPWCRSVVPTMIDVASDMEIDEIYYIDIKDIRDTYEIVDGEVKETKKGTSEYYDLLKNFDNVLSEYKLTNTEGEQIEIKEKRIYAPNIIIVVKGKPIMNISGIPVDLTDPYMEITEEMHEEIYRKFECAFRCLDKNKTCEQTC